MSTHSTHEKLAVSASDVCLKASWLRRQAAQASLKTANACERVAAASGEYRARGSSKSGSKKLVRSASLAWVGVVDGGEGVGGGAQAAASTVHSRRVRIDGSSKTRCLRFPPHKHANR